MAKNIDLDRGVVIMQHTTGVNIYMYVDEPGVFRNAFGNEVSDVLAKQAGYDVERLTRAKVKRERMAAAMASIEAELEDTGEKFKKVRAVRSGFRLVDIGLGRFYVEDPDGDNMNKVPLSREQALPLLEAMAPEGETEECIDAEDESEEGLEARKPSPFNVK